MPPVLIDLGEDLTAKVRTLGANVGFQSAEAYVIAVVEADAADASAPVGSELDAPGRTPTQS